MRRHPSQDGRKPESTTPISCDDGDQAAHDTYCSTCYEILQASMRSEDLVRESEDRSFVIAKSFDGTRASRARVGWSTRRSLCMS